MKAELIKIGNSQGLRIPKPVIEQCGFKHTVNLQIKGHSLIISPDTDVRKNWEQAFQKMSDQEDDKLLLENVKSNSFDDEEWTW